MSTIATLGADSKTAVSEPRMGRLGLPGEWLWLTV